MLLNMKIKAYLLRLLTQKKSIDFDLKNTSTVLFFRYDRIGDMIISTPVFRELKLANPHISISVLASKSNKEVLLNNPYVNHIYVNHKNNFFKDLPSLIKLRKKKFDVCVEFDHSVIPHAILRLIIIKPKKVISVKKNGRYGVNGNELSLYDNYTERGYQKHFRDILLETIKPMGVVEPKSKNYDLFITNIQRKQAKKFVEYYHSKILIGINLEGAIKSKKIGFSELNEICKGLHRHFDNLQIIILSTPKKFQSIRKKIAKIELDFISASYKTDTILDVAALVSQLDFIISPDTSISHVASAFNIPVVTIHEKNQESYQLFAPTSTLNRTVFSKSKDSLIGFSIDLLIDYCIELINLNKKGDYE